VWFHAALGGIVEQHRICDVFNVRSACVLAALALMASAGPTTAQDQSRPAQCKLVVRGTTIIDGECLFRQQRDGSFQIVGREHFAYVTVTGNTAEGSWNEDPRATHAGWPLGTLRRQGACWINTTTQICATNLSASAEAAARASMPSGEFIYPAFPGAAATCVMARDGRWVEGAELVLVARCPGAAAAHRFVRSAGTLAIDKVNGLCVGLSRTGNRATVVLQTCANASARWTTTATSVTAARVHSEAGECWTVPGIESDATRWPIVIEARRCNDATAPPREFFFER
jgi:hypothetical protein